MNANSLLTQLSFSEFSNLALSNEGDGTIRKKDMGRVLTFINDGMSDISTKLKLSEKIVHIQLYEPLTNYHLVSRFAESQQPQPDVDFPYILDMNRQPFKGDVLKITSVWDSEGRERKLNDESDVRGVFTLNNKILTVPYPENGVVLFVHYIASPQQVTQDNLDEELDIPDYLVPALRLFVANRVFMSLGTSDSMRLGQEYQNQYLMLMNDIQAANLNSDSRFTVNPFEDRGWV